MAMFSINDSSLGKYLNENRSLKQYANNFSDKSSRNNKQMYTDLKKVTKIQGNTTAKALKSNDDLADIHEFIKDGNTAISMHAKTPAQKYLAKKISKKIAGATGAELKRRGLDPKTGKKLEEAAKLREAAEYILSVLDEENLDKYLNEGNKAFKHIADIESKTNPYENRSSKQIQSDVIKVMPRQMKEVIGNNYSDETLKKINNVIKNGRNAVSDIYKNKGAAGQYLAKKASNKLAGYTGAELKRRGIDPKTGEKLK